MQLSKEFNTINYLVKMSASNLKLAVACHGGKTTFLFINIIIGDILIVNLLIVNVLIVND